MIELRPYQSELVALARARFHDYLSVLMVAPTGSGKTIMFSHLAQRVAAKGNRILVLVHRDELLDQVSDTLGGFDVPHSFIAAGRAFDRCAQVQVASVFSVARRLAKLGDWRPNMIIVDEAHHAVSGSTWSKVLTAFPQAYVLGVTATPERLSGEGLRDHFSHMIEGPSVRELINLGALCDFKVYAPQVDIGKVPKRAGDYAQDALAVAMNKPSITGDALQHYKRLADGKRALAFCVSLDHAWSVAQTFLHAGYQAQRIDGSMDKQTRRQLVRDFSRGGVQVMTSCELVSEGFDLPAIECGIMLRPTESLSLHLQQVGRTLRPFAGKPHAIILDHANNTAKHGLPDEIHAWSLDGRPKKKRGASDDAPAIRTCDECYATVPATALSCRYCGFTFKIKPREVKQVDGELAEVKATERKPVTREETAEARTLQQLVKLGQARGMKNAGFWAIKVFNGRRR